MARKRACLLMAATVFLLLGMAPPEKPYQAKGHIKSLSIDKKEFVLRDMQGHDLKFQFDEMLGVRINGKSAQYRDLKVGDEAVVRYEKDGQLLIPGRILCTRPQAPEKPER